MELWDDIILESSPNSLQPQGLGFAVPHIQITVLLA